MKKYLIALAVVVLFIIIAGAIYLKLSNPSTTVPGPVACTMEAKLCPDGVTSVGRQGPNCAFDECPVSQTVGKVSDWKTYKNAKAMFEIVYPQDFYVTQEGTWGKEGDGNFFAYYTDISKYKVAPPKEFEGVRIIVQSFRGDLEKKVDDSIKNRLNPSNDAVSKQTLDDWNRNITKKQITVDGANGFIVRYGEKRTGTDVYLAQNDQIFIFVSKIDENLFSQILSTFKFTK